MDWQNGWAKNEHILKIIDQYCTKPEDKEMDYEEFLAMIGYTIFTTPRHSRRYPWPYGEEKEHNEMKKDILTVNKIEFYNERVVLIRWGDGTFTKAVCSPNDKFDIDVGIQVCYLKKLIGTENYYKFLHDSHKFLKLQEDEKAKAAEEKKARREKQKRIAEKKAKKRQAHIDAYKNDITEAVVAALDRHVGDDLK